VQGIYKIENLINGKCYVGQSVDIKKRWKQHKRTYYNSNLNKYNYPLYNSMRKHGIDNFEFSVLETVHFADDLTRREMYWYNKLKPKYNLEIPNKSHPSGMKSIVQIDINTGQKINEYDSITEAAKAVNGDTSSITKACKGKLFAISGYLWCYSDQFENWVMPEYKKMNIPVHQIDANTNDIIKTYFNARQATEETGVQFQNIQKVCSGKRNKAGGFVWRYAT